MEKNELFLNSLQFRGAYFKARNGLDRAPALAAGRSGAPPRLLKRAMLTACNDRCAAHTACTATRKVFMAHNSPGLVARAAVILRPIERRSI